MATSELGHYVRFDEATVASPSGTEAPFSTGHARRAIGNLNHLADQYAQRRIAWVGRTLTVDEDVIVDGVFGFLWASGSFDLHVDGTGESYALRGRLRLSSDDAVASATFRVVIAHENASLPELFEAGDHTDEITVVRSGFDWDATSLLYLDAFRIAAAQREVAAIDAVGGDPLSAVWVRARMWIFAKRQSSLAEARLSGVQLDEYIAP